MPEWCNECDVSLARRICKCGMWLCDDCATLHELDDGAMTFDQYEHERQKLTTWERNVADWPSVRGAK